MRAIFILCVFSTSSYLTIVQAELTVSQVQVLFRHGDRTPRRDDMYPNDIHDESKYKSWGLGQLTNVGKVREYRIGQMLRTRYHYLMKTIKLPYAVHAVSASTDRTKTSLQVLLAGLFPPSEEQKWHPELPWMPIATHYVPHQLDILMKPYLCPQFRNSVDRTLQLPEIKARIAGFNDLFEFLTNKTGLNITSPYAVNRIYNLLDSEKSMNLTLPEWFTDDVHEEISKVAILKYDISSYTSESRRLYGGMLVRKFIENMHLDKAQPEDPRMIYLYSAHDGNVSAFLRALGILVHKIPFFGTAVMFEKLEDTYGNRFVRVVLWTGVTEQLITLRIPGCEEICPIETYLKLTREVIPSDDEMDCHWRRLSPSQLRAVFDDGINYN